MSLADVLDPMARCIESESSLDEMNRLCRRVTQYIDDGHRLDNATKKNMRPLLEKCLTNQWYQQFQTLSHLVYGEDAIWSSEPRYKIATSAWDQVALLDSEAEVVRLQTELFTATQVADMAKALVQTMQRSANSEENALLLEVRVENAVAQATEAGLAAAGATENASKAARLVSQAMDDIRAVESTVTSQADRIRRLEENALNNLSPDILQLIKIVSRELDLANALAEVTDELIVCLESMYIEDILGDRTTDIMAGDAEALRQINKRLADVCTGIRQRAVEKVSLPTDMIRSLNDSLYVTVFDWIGSSADIPFIVSESHIMDDPMLIHKIAKRNETIERLVMYKFYSGKLGLLGTGQGDIQLSEASYHAFDQLVSRVRTKRESLNPMVDPADSKPGVDNAEDDTGPSDVYNDGSDEGAQIDQNSQGGGVGEGHTTPETRFVFYSPYLDNQRNSIDGIPGDLKLRCAKLVLPLSRTSHYVEVLSADVWKKATVVATVTDQVRVHFNGAQTRQEDVWVKMDSDRVRWPTARRGEMDDPMILPRIRLTSDMSAFELVPGNHNVVFPQSVPTGRHNIASDTSRGPLFSTQTSREKRSAKFFGYIDHPYATMPAVSLESRGGRLAPAPFGATQIAPLPRGYENTMISQDPEEKHLSPTSYYRILKVDTISSLTTPLLCQSMESATVAGKVLASGLVLCSSSFSSDTQQSKLITGVEITRWDHSLKVRGSPGWTRQPCVWMWTLEREVKRMFEQSNSRLFIFWKSVVMGTTHEGVVGATDDKGIIIGTLSIKSFIELQKCRRKPVALRWATQPTEDFCTPFSTTVAYELIQHVSVLANSPGLVSNKAYPLSIGPPVQPRSQDHVFWLHKGDPYLMSSIVPDWEKSLLHAASILPPARKKN
jgi:hypothetical protein